MANRDRLWGVVYVLPALALVLAFIAYPLASVIYHAFTEWDGINPPEWVGFDNFTELVDDPVFRTSLRNNALFALSVPIQVTVPLVLAWLIHERIPGWRFFRSTFFLPAVISTVVVGLVAQVVFRLERPAELAARLGRPVLPGAGLAGQGRDLDPGGPARARVGQLRLQHAHLPGGDERARPVADRGRANGRGAPHARALLDRRPQPQAGDGAGARDEHGHGVRVHVRLHLRDHERRPGLRHLRDGVHDLQGGVRAREQRLRLRDRRRADAHRGVDRRPADPDPHRGAERDPARGLEARAGGGRHGAHLRLRAVPAVLHGLERLSHQRRLRRLEGRPALGLLASTPSSGPGRARASRPTCATR